MGLPTKSISEGSKSPYVLFSENLTPIDPFAEAKLNAVAVRNLRPHQSDRSESQKVSVSKKKDQKIASILAAKNYELEAVQFLLARGGNPDYLEFSTQCKAVGKAAEKGHVDVIQELLKTRRLRFDIDCMVDGEGIADDTPLTLAAGNGKPEVVQLLLNHGAGNFDNGDYKAFLEAARKGHVDVMQALWDHKKIDINQGNGETALAGAARNSELGAVRFLLDHGADVTLVDSSGKTAFMQAAEKGHVDVMQALWDHKKIDINQRDTMWGKTALMLAADHGEAVLFLLSHGAVPLEPDEFEPGKFEIEEFNDESDRQVFRLCPLFPLMIQESLRENFQGLHLLAKKARENPGHYRETIYNASESLLNFLMLNEQWALWNQFVEILIDRENKEVKLSLPPPKSFSYEFVEQLCYVLRKNGITHLTLSLNKKDFNSQTHLRLLQRLCAVPQLVSVAIKNEGNLWKPSIFGKAKRIYDLLQKQLEQNCLVNSETTRYAEANGDILAPERLSNAELCVFFQLTGQYAGKGLLLSDSKWRELYSELLNTPLPENKNIEIEVIRVCNEKVKNVRSILSSYNVIQKDAKNSEILNLKAEEISKIEDQKAAEMCIEFIRELKSYSKQYELTQAYLKAICEDPALASNCGIASDLIQEAKPYQVQFWSDSEINKAPCMLDQPGAEEVLHLYSIDDEPCRLLQRDPISQDRPREIQEHRSIFTPLAEDIKEWSALFVGIPLNDVSLATPNQEGAKEHLEKLRLFVFGQHRYWVQLQTKANQTNYHRYKHLSYTIQALDHYQLHMRSLELSAYTPATQTDLEKIGEKMVQAQARARESLEERTNGVKKEQKLKLCVRQFRQHLQMHWQASSALASGDIQQKSGSIDHLWHFSNSLLLGLPAGFALLGTTGGALAHQLGMLPEIGHVNHMLGEATNTTLTTRFQGLLHSEKEEWLALHRSFEDFSDFDDKANYYAHLFAHTFEEQLGKLSLTDALLFTQYFVDCMILLLKRPVDAENPWKPFNKDLFYQLIIAPPKKGPMLNYTFKDGSNRRIRAADILRKTGVECDESGHSRQFDFYHRNGDEEYGTEGNNYGYRKALKDDIDQITKDLEAYKVSPEEFRKSSQDYSVTETSLRENLAIDPESLAVIAMEYQTRAQWQEMVEQRLRIVEVKQQLIQESATLGVYVMQFMLYTRKISDLINENKGLSEAQKQRLQTIREIIDRHIEDINKSCLNILTSRIENPFVLKVLRSRKQPEEILEQLNKGFREQIQTVRNVLVLDREEATEPVRLARSPTSPLLRFLSGPHQGRRSLISVPYEGRRLSDDKSFEEEEKQVLRKS